VLSVILLARSATPELGLAMAALVPGAVHGMIHQVVAADPVGGAEMADLWPEDGLRRLGEALSRGVRAGVVRGEGAGGLMAAFQARPYGLLAMRADIEALKPGDGLAALKRRLGRRAARVV
jgi:hypothetical protein